MLKIIAVIPARYESSRFPGKPLAMIMGKPMIQYVYEQVKKVKLIETVLVAVDDNRIYDAVNNFGGKAILTGQCSCGTERVYEAIRDYNCDVVINIQGDEPLIQPQMINELILAIQEEGVNMATLCKEIDVQTDLDNPNIVKVVKKENGDALYFSRYPIPYNRDGLSFVKYYKHIGIYGYTKKFLEQYVKMPKTYLECMENLEQLRVLENGYSIRVCETHYDSIGVDLPEHIQKIEEVLRNAK